MPTDKIPGSPIAYNYTTQQWVEGEEARLERRNQLLEEIELLKSPRGAEYLRFLGSAHTVEEALKKASEELIAVNMAP